MFSYLINVHFIYVQEQPNIKLAFKGSLNKSKQKIKLSHFYDTIQRTMRNVYWWWAI